jgi:hypothetical protein
MDDYRKEGIILLIIIFVLGGFFGCGLTLLIIG